MLSFTSHFQIIIIWICTLLSKLKFTYKNKSYCKYSFSILICLSISYLLIYINCFGIFKYLYENIKNKLLFYYGDGVKLNYYTLYMMLIYIPYFLYLYIFGLKDTYRKLFLPSTIIFLISVILNFYRINLLLFGYMYIIEINRLIDGKKYAALPVTGFFLYNIYQLNNFIFNAIFA